ncbi:hypothetical protein MASR1M101_41430 [Gemmatimonas sp.]
MVLAVVERVLATVGSLEDYWLGIEHRGVPLHECAGAIASVMLAKGIEDRATMEANAIAASLALMAPVPVNPARA